MPMLPRLLCYGHDELLLYTRKKVLEPEFFVEVCTDIPSLEQTLSRGPCEIAVLCHSVPDAECQEVLLRVREHCPDVKVLVLYEYMPEQCTDESDRTMGCLEGPAMLLKDVHALMEEAAEMK